MGVGPDPLVGDRGNGFGHDGHELCPAVRSHTRGKSTQQLSFALTSMRIPHLMVICIVAPLQ